MVIGTVHHQDKRHRYGYGFSFIQVSQEIDPAEVSFGDKELKNPWSNPVWISEVFHMRENGMGAWLGSSRNIQGDIESSINRGVFFFVHCGILSTSKCPPPSKHQIICLVPGE